MKLFAPLVMSMLVASLVGCDKATKKDEPWSDSSAPATVDTKGAVPAQIPEGSENAERLQADLRTLKDATVAGDVATVIRYMHPKLIEMAGGEQAYAKVFDDTFSGMQEAKVTISISFPADPQFVQTKERLYAIVPQKVVMTVPAGGIETTSFQLGVLENGNTEWKYLDVSKFDRQMLKELFPDFPEDYTFPEVTMKQL